LAFKDSLSYLDHLNSSQHYRQLGISGQVERATVEEVKERLAWLIELKREKEKEKEKGEGLDLMKRVAERKRVEEEEKRRRREKKKAQRRQKRQQDLGASDVEMDN